MAVPQLTLLPDPPLLTDDEDTYNAKADATVIAQQKSIPEINTSLTWIGAQVTAIGGYATTASNAATSASDSATLAGQAKTQAQAAAAAAGSAAGLPSLAGNDRRPLGVVPGATGVSWLTAIKSLYIEPSVKQSSGGAVSLNLGTSGLFDVTLTSNTTFTFTGVPSLSATEMLVVVVRVTNGATGYSVTWPAGIVWEASGRSDTANSERQQVPRVPVHLRRLNRNRS